MSEPILEGLVSEVGRALYAEEQPEEDTEQLGYSVSFRLNKVEKIFMTQIITMV